MKRLFLMTCAMLGGCVTGSNVYVPPSFAPVRPPALLIDRPLDAVWAAAIPSIGKDYFVVNNIDKPSGFINLSYSGDPELYVDCGQVTSEVNAVGALRKFTFPGSKAYVQYQTVAGAPGNRRVFDASRRMSLEGRMNLVFEAVTPTSTRVSTNTRYVLTREQTFRAGGGFPTQLRDSISFNSGSIGRFPLSDQGGEIECRPNGALEKSLLDLISPPR